MKTISNLLTSQVEKEEVVVDLEKKEVVTNSMTWTTERPPQII